MVFVCNLNNLWVTITVFFVCKAGRLPFVVYFVSLSEIVCQQLCLGGGYLPFVGFIRLLL